MFAQVAADAASTGTGSYRAAHIDSSYSPASRPMAYDSGITSASGGDMYTSDVSLRSADIRGGLGQLCESGVASGRSRLQLHSQESAPQPGTLFQSGNGMGHASGYTSYGSG